MSTVMNIIKTKFKLYQKKPNLSWTYLKENIRKYYFWAFIFSFANQAIFNQSLKVAIQQFTSDRYQKGRKQCYAQA